MPKLGMEMEDGTVLKWQYSEGEPVAEGAVLAEVESEKTTAEITAREDGVLRRILVEPGETVPTGAPLGVLAQAEEPIDNLLARAEPDRSDGPTEYEDTDHGDDPDHVDTQVTTSQQETKLTPRARKLAAAHDVDASQIEATGFQDAVSGADVLRAVDGDRHTQGSSGTPTVREHRPFNGVRQTRAARPGRSESESAHVTVHRDVNAEPLLAAVTAAEQALDSKISVIDLLIAATSRTLQDHPRFNGAVHEDRLALFDEHNIAVAVDTDQGLLSPVISDVRSKSVPEIATARRRLVDDARAGTLSPDALTGGTFTISNLGAFGVDSFTPIINPPQVAILGVDAIEERPVVIDGSVVVKPVIGFDLTFDHRAVDGADAARFLQALATALENAAALLPTAARDSDQPASDDSTTDRSVRVETEGGLSGCIQAGGFEWAVDEPVDVGGSGAAPSPVAQFLGSLAACLAISIGVQARKRDIELDAVDVDVDATPEQGHVSEITVRIDVTPRDDIAKGEIDDLMERGKRSCYVSSLLREDLDITYSRVG
jgi:pyruvate dehydrogenase E2 component (dihydrolipoamide acetyltransferase)